MTRTGIKLAVILIQNGDDVSGTYIGHNGIAGHLTGKLDNNGVIQYQWVQRPGEASNTGADGGWGRMTFDGASAITGMKTAWGRPNDTGPVGFWTCGSPL